MRRSLRVVGWLAVVLGIALGTGCTKPALREKPPPDPLLTSKKPIDGKPLTREERPAPREDYAPPPRPVVDEEILPVGVLGSRPLNADRR